MTALTMPATRTATHESLDLRRVLVTVRTAPAPRWEGSAADRARYVAYVAGSMVGWTALGLGSSALVGLLVSLGG